MKTKTKNNKTMSEDIKKTVHGINVRQCYKCKGYNHLASEC